ncbi:L,D-transpeptidase [Mesorhizobium plurifarium]|uniref:L,D-transpeptidase n=1 Tax=Sinorhizobium arboris TaxID=76745 RepID=UPI00041E66A8|nr:L,D-transpeptidase [Sinorhizobium arboris]PST26248.1 L,D-transpeptidase [Mesorhizobium plurifarium]
MLKKSLCLAMCLFPILSGAAGAQDRYQNRPPVIVSPDLTAPWVMQLTGERVVYRQQAPTATRKMPGRRELSRRPATATVQPASIARRQKPSMSKFDPQFLPQMVAYETKEKPGTIIIDTNNRFLYLVTARGEARRYGVGVGKPGFEWAGEHRITRKAEWPNWTPPQEMIAREAAKGHFLPARMDGGPDNPLGARAMYLGSTLYRIHGTNAPWTIGYGVSSGCIRMRNEDVVDLYERVKVGTKVIVI